MKLSVFTVSTPDMTPEQLASAAAELGIEGIEWRYKEPAEGIGEQPPSFWGNNYCTIIPSKGESELDRFRLAAQSAGVHSLSVTPYLQAGDLEETEQVLRAAKRIGADFIRLGVPWYHGTKSYGELLEEGRAYLRTAAGLCKEYGVKGLVETHHGSITASASAAYRFCEGMNPEHIGVLYDPGNLVYEGFENYKMGMELLGPYLAHVHIKNAAWRQSGYYADGSDRWIAEWRGLKRGGVPWETVIRALAEIGYDGYLGVEDFSGQFADSKQMLKHFTEYVGELLDKVRL